MSTSKLPCGCVITRDARDREEYASFCMEHEIEFIERHAAAVAVASCSHANRDLTDG